MKVEIPDPSKVWDCFICIQ